MCWQAQTCGRSPACKGSVTCVMIGGAKREGEVQCRFASRTDLPLGRRRGRRSWPSRLRSRFRPASPRMAIGPRDRIGAGSKGSSGPTIICTPIGSLTRNRCSAAAPPTLSKPGSGSKMPATDTPRTSGTPGWTASGPGFLPRRSSKTTLRTGTLTCSCWLGRSNASYARRAAFSVPHLACSAARKGVGTR